MKVALVGTSSCGKTTLINDIDQKKIFKNHSIILEIAGNFSKESRKRLSTQISIIKAQVAEEKKYDNFISDRSVMDNTAYFMYHYRKSSVKSRYHQDYVDYAALFNAHMITKPYDAVVFINEYFELEDNGIREMDAEMQEWVFDYLNDIVPIWCDIYNIPLYNLSGSPDERIKKIQKLLKPHYSQKRMSDF